MKALSEIDKNFIPATLGNHEYLFRDCREEPFRLYGLILPNEEDPHFMRLPSKVASTVNGGVLSLASCTAGGRIRFRTDSPSVAIRTKMHNIYHGDHFPMTGSAGFDLYADGVYRNTFRPPFDVKDGFDSCVDLKEKKMRDILIHMPLYSGVISLEIGVEPGSQLLPGDEYKYTTPVVYYGSSITQGGCASRPGMCYHNVLARRLNRDFWCLGFSGNALGEDAIAQYIAGLDMSIFVYDYDNNAPTVEHLRDTHEKMFRTIRQAQPDLPILILPRPKYSLTEEEWERQRVIRKTYENALAAGDKNVYFIDSQTLMALCKEDGLVDDGHPTDFGFASMANAIGDALEQIINK